MEFDIIERKGIGHPDSIADALSERLSQKLEEAYVKGHGRHMHYNVDKVLVTAGKVSRGKMTKPVHIIFAGQYTRLPHIDKLLKDTVYDVLSFEISNGLQYKIHNLLNPGARDLTKNYDNRKSNDTSFAVGSPVSDNERTVLEIGRYLDSLHDQSPPFFGRDNKVMFIQNGNTKKAYIALATIKPCEFTDAEFQYDRITREVHDHIEQTWSVTAIINNAGPFITLTGTSLEQGDSGMTGRGNRYNGLITPLRPMTMEAYCGKNNQTHIGKIYQKKAHDMAQARNKHILLLNKIGNDIEDPEVYEW